MVLEIGAGSRVAGNARTPRGERCEQKRFFAKAKKRPAKLYAEQDELDQ